MNKALKRVLITGLVCGLLYLLIRWPIEAYRRKDWPVVSVYVNVMDPDTSGYKVSLEQKKVKKGSNYEAKIKEYENHHFVASKSNYKATNIQNSIILNLYYDCDTCTVQFKTDGGIAHEPLIYQVNIGSKFKAPLITKDHYTLVGWQNYQEIITRDAVFVPIWEVSKYRVTFVVAPTTSISGGNIEKVSGTSTYSLVLKYGDDLNLENLKIIDTNNHFKRWQYNNEDITYLNNVEKDMFIVASYEEKLYAINYYLNNSADAYYYPSLMYLSGSYITPPKIKPQDQVVGSGLVWYEDENHLKPYFFNQMPDYSLTLYGEWEEDTGVDFLTYDLKKSTIDSYNELRLFLRAISFTQKDQTVQRLITFCKPGEVSSLIDKIYEEEFEYMGVSYRHGFENTQDELFEFQFKKSTYANYPVRTTDDIVIDTYQPLDYNNEAKRSAFFNDFYIEKLTNSYEVKTSNQLLYVAERGFKPICSGKAQSVYKEAKKVLREIVNDDMTDLKKAEAIFNYLVYNVVYDFEAFNRDLISSDACYIEGVLNHHKAVCDGIAKTFSLLCNMEGIPCVRVDGNNHAWCKVKINNIWFVVDPTHSIMHFEGVSFKSFNYSQFLISDSMKASFGYTTNKYPLIKCPLVYPYLQNKTYELAGTKHSYVIHSADELCTLWRFIETKIKDKNQKYQLCFALSDGLSIELLNNDAKILYFAKYGHPFSFDYVYNRERRNDMQDYTILIN